MNARRPTTAVIGLLLGALVVGCSGGSPSENCCYPNAAGQQKIAELLLAAGIEPQALS